MFEIKIADPTTNPNYDQWLGRFEGASIFHSSEWAKVIKSSYGYSPIYIIALSEGNVNCIFPLMEINSWATGKRAVSLPFTDYCGPMYLNQHSFRKVLDYTFSLGKMRKWKTVKMRGGEEFHKGSLVNSTYMLHILTLKKNVENTFKSLRSSTRRNIKKAMRLGLNTHVSDDLDGVKEFYRLHCLTRKKHGLPPQPFLFFKNIYTHIISTGKGYVVLSEHEGRNVAAAVYFVHGDKVLYKYGASDPGKLDLRANNLVMWHAIKLSIEKKMCEFNFGRTELYNKGLIQFKDGWGTDRKLIEYYTYSYGTSQYLTGGKRELFSSLNEIMKYMPVQLLRGIGKILYRHVG